MTPEQLAEVRERMSPWSPDVFESNPDYAVAIPGRLVLALLALAERAEKYREALEKISKTRINRDAPNHLNPDQQTAVRGEILVWHGEIARAALEAARPAQAEAEPNYYWDDMGKTHQRMDP